VTRVCLLGDPDVNLTYELLSRETARDALATYEIEEPFENSVAVDTVSLGAAVSLLMTSTGTSSASSTRRSFASHRSPRRVALSRPRPRGARRRRPPEETDQRLKCSGSSTAGRSNPSTFGERRARRPSTTSATSTRR